MSLRWRLEAALAELLRRAGTLAGLLAAAVFVGLVLGLPWQSQSLIRFAWITDWLLPISVAFSFLSGFSYLAELHR